MTLIPPTPLPPTPIHYRCDCCGDYFEAAWSDTEAVAEAQRDFGVDDPVAAGYVQVCDLCYRTIRQRVADEGIPW